MEEQKLRGILKSVQSGETTVDNAVNKLRNLPYKDLGFAAVDHHRELRLGFPEVVLGSCKTREQIIGITDELKRGGCNILVTRVSPELARKIREIRDEFKYHSEARALIYQQHPVSQQEQGLVLVATGGTGDIPVAEEACVTLELMGHRYSRMYDVGVAGIHRILGQRHRLIQAEVIIVAAGMDGVLASVIAGLVPRPVIGVPTSVGYGANLGGFAPLLTMVNSCSAGVGLVNIDNGFGAAYLAALINRKNAKADYEG